MHFGITISKERFFLGGKKKRVGIYVDLPWSEDCKEYGAPYAVYIHWWPGRVKRISLPFKNKRYEEMMENAEWSRGGVELRCSVCKKPIDRDNEPVAWGNIEISLNKGQGDRLELGSIHSVLCPEHAKMAEEKTLSPRWVVEV